ncbi:MAG: sulfatase [Planctomycetota bacterium]|jgi:arylsulfatase A-like enzyme
MILPAACSERRAGQGSVDGIAPSGGGSVLFDYFGTEGCEASFGMAAFQEDLSDKIQPLEGGAKGYICPPDFYPSENGVGILTLGGKPIEQAAGGTDAEGERRWSIERADPVYPLGKEMKPLRISCEKGKSSKVFSLERIGPPREPFARLLSMKVRGVRSHNRYPLLMIKQEKTLSFQAIIPHGKPLEYRIPLYQTGASHQVYIEVRGVEASIPVLADHSTTEAYVQIDEVKILDFPRIRITSPAEEGGAPLKGELKLTWLEFPERDYSPLETPFRIEPDPALVGLFLERTAQRGVKLGRVTLPGIKFRKPARFAFPVTFLPSSSLTFSVGLMPAYRNHVFVEVSAIMDGDRQVLIEKAIAQPLLEPEARWHDFHVNIPSDLKGEGVLEFRFTDAPPSAEPVESGDEESAPNEYGIFGSARLISKAEARGMTPNLIVVSIDTLRADHLSCYGYDFETTPNMDRFAEEALVFSNAMSTSSWTLPAHLSLLGGVPLGQHGGLYKDRRIHPSIPTLAERLRNGGYETAAFVGGGYVSADFGMDQGFDYFDERSLDISGGHGRVASWLKEQAGRNPFFLFYHFFDVHSPYGDKTSDPERFFLEADCPYIESLAKEIKEGQYTREHSCGSFKVHISDLARRHMIHLYDADVRHVDDWMEKFFGLLREMNLFENSAIVITSDHGEEFGEHGNWHHSKHLYREVVNVPLILKLPGAGKKGRVETPVSLLDIPPTLTVLAGVETPEEWYGTSLLRIVETPRDFLGRKVMSENIIPHGNRQVNMIAFQDGDKKYFRLFCGKGEPYAEGERGFHQGDRQELYLLGPDPLEQVNVGDCFPRLRASFNKESQIMIQKMKTELHSEGSFGRREISEEVLKQLEALGYLK